MPFPNFDMPFNAKCVARAGLGPEPLLFQQLSEKTLISRLNQLIFQENYRYNTSKAVKIISGEEPYKKIDLALQ